MRFATEVETSTLPCPRSPPSGGIRDVHPPEGGAVDPRNAVVPGQPLVHEGVVGGVQLHQAPVLLHQVVEEEFGLPAPLASRSCWSKSGNQKASGVHPVQVLEAEPLGGEAGGQPPPPGGSASIRRVWASSTSGSPNPPPWRPAPGAPHPGEHPRGRRRGGRPVAPSGDGVDLTGLHAGGGPLQTGRRSGGLARMAWSPVRIPSSKPPSLSPCR